MNMSEVTRLVFDHDRLLAEMSGDEVLKEYTYLLSGCADDVDARKGVKLGLCAKLAARKDTLEKQLIGSIDFYLKIMKEINER
jgi:hypothetical protein